ncbi:hypothetical protein FXW78_55080 [Rhodococcus opacus]|nr:hypothetical protein [Rhodococcus opacus]
MARYFPNQISSSFNPGPSRPPLEQLPADLGALLAERDTALERYGVAQQTLSYLAQPERDAEAKRTDDENDAAAARAGKKIPPASATKKLIADRDQAEREVQAHKAAFAAVDNDCSTAFAANPEAEAEKAAARERVAKLADALADEIEREVAASALNDWLAGRGYFIRAEVSLMDVDPALEGQGINRMYGPHDSVRNYIRNIARTVLED